MKGEGAWTEQGVTRRATRLTLVSEPALQVFRSAISTGSLRLRVSRDPFGKVAVIKVFGRLDTEANDIGRQNTKSNQPMNCI